MSSLARPRSFILLVAALILPWTALQSVAAQQKIPVDSLPNETPAHFTPVDSSFDFMRRDVMIPMRDGVKLHTVILIPRGAKDAPMLMTRTPYNADARASRAYTSQMGPRLGNHDPALEAVLGGGYIRVIQDIRGKYGSEGEYVMNRPFVGPLNPTKVDESTDTWDTIDWLVKHVPESNGKVGILGISYDGFLSLTPLVNPHPALKVVVPMNPMVDGWMGDDWFHHGAFRERGMNMPYILEQEASRTGEYHWWTNTRDAYDLYMNGVSAGQLGKEHGLEQVGFWRKILQHPDYDRWWQLQAVDSILARQPLKVPVMLVQSLWDQEDIYGATAVYRALEPKDSRNDSVYLVIGPWHHGQEADLQGGSSLGALRFPTNTSLYFQRHILAPFLAHYLKDGSPPDSVAPVTAYLTGADRWERLQSWPSGCASGCAVTPTPLYLEGGLKVGFRKPAVGDSAFDWYISDPAKPVPFRHRPIYSQGNSDRSTWSQWLVDDQREFSGRTDVLAYESAPLTDSVQISGRPLVHLVASTTGTDADWVVKLIDVYPPEDAEQPDMGGYQLAVSMDIFRGRYRESYSKPEPITPNQPLVYTFHLPTANHVFRPGHRIMVQIQSSWFPLYDRNPQTFVNNIFWARPGDYRKATMRIYHTPSNDTYLDLPLVKKTGG